MYQIGRSGERISGLAIRPRCLMKVRLTKRVEDSTGEYLRDRETPYSQGISVMRWNVFCDARAFQKLLQLLWPRSLTLSRQADKSERSFEGRLRRSLCRRLCRTKPNPPHHRRRKATNRRRARPPHPAA